MDKYISLWDTADFLKLCHKNSEAKKDKIDNFDFLNFCVADNQTKNELNNSHCKEGREREDKLGKCFITRRITKC